MSTHTGYNKILLIIRSIVLTEVLLIYTDWLLESEKLKLMEQNS